MDSREHSWLTQITRTVGAALTRIETAHSLDKVAGPVSSVVDRFVPVGTLRDLLHGVPFGHPAHPMLVQVPLGAWLSAVVLDRMRGQHRASTLLVGVGTAAAVPAAAAGIVDWAKTHQSQQRVGLVHWAANTVAVGFFAASFVQRVRGHQASGRRLALLGMTAASAGGFLGGHLAYRQAVGANHNERIPYVLPDEWESMGALDDVPERELVRRHVGDVPVLLYRTGANVRVLADECTHLAGPLSDGELCGDRDDLPCVRCPWHGSEFSLVDGAVIHGPATSPQHLFRTRVRDGQVEVNAH